LEFSKHLLFGQQLLFKRGMTRDDKEEYMKLAIFDFNGSLPGEDISTKRVVSVHVQTGHWFSILLEGRQGDGVLPTYMLVTA
jgi:hypothetical protein